MSRTPKCFPCVQLKAHLRTSEEPDVPKALLLRDSFLLRENLWLQHSSHLTNTCLCRVVDAVGVT